MIVHGVKLIVVYADMQMPGDNILIFFFFFFSPNCTLREVLEIGNSVHDKDQVKFVRC